MIHLHNLTKKFDNFTAVDNLSLEIQAGEVFAFLGPNGSGKTTTLKMIVGLAMPSAGKITIQGQDFAGSPPKTRQVISYLPQRVSVADNLTAWEVMEFYRRIRGVSMERMQMVLDNSRLDGAIHRPVGEFSGGMLQRLGLAIAVLPDTPILILDEPTVSLDPEGSLAFRQFIADQKARGKTIVFSSHTLSDIQAVADRVAILVSGRLATLEPVSVLRQMLTARAKTRVVIGNWEDRFCSIACQNGATMAEFVKGSLLITSPPAPRLKIVEALEQAGAQIEQFATEEPSLEEIYLQLVQATVKPKLSN